MELLPYPIGQRTRSLCNNNTLRKGAACVEDLRRTHNPSRDQLHGVESVLKKIYTKIIKYGL